MEVVKKRELEKVKLEDLDDGECFYDDATDYQYSIKTNDFNTKNNEILTVCLLDGEAYWENKDIKVIRANAKILIEEK